MCPNYLYQVPHHDWSNWVTNNLYVWTVPIWMILAFSPIKSLFILCISLPLILHLFDGCLNFGLVTQKLTGFDRSKIFIQLQQDWHSCGQRYIHNVCFWYICWERQQKCVIRIFKVYILIPTALVLLSTLYALLLITFKEKYYNLKELFTILIYIWNVTYSCDAKLYFQQHTLIFSVTWFFRNHS